MTPQIKRLIKENPNLSNSKIAMLTGLKPHAIRNNRDKSKWRYSGIGLPFLFFSMSSAMFCVDYKHNRLYTGGINTAINVVDHLIWCIEKGMFDKPRVEHPYLQNLKFGG